MLGQTHKKRPALSEFTLKVTFAMELFPRPALPEGVSLYETTTFPDTSEPQNPH